MARSDFTPRVFLDHPLGAGRGSLSTGHRPPTSSTVCACATGKACCSSTDEQALGTALDDFEPERLLVLCEERTRRFASLRATMPCRTSGPKRPERLCSDHVKVLGCEPELGPVIEL